MGDKVLGTIKIEICEGGLQNIKFTGLVEPNDVFSTRVTLQNEYATYLHERHLQETSAGKEKKRVAAQKEAADKEKALKVEQEKEAARIKKEEADKVAKAKAEEAKAKKKEQDVKDAKEGK